MTATACDAEALSQRFERDTNLAALGHVFPDVPYRSTRSASAGCA